MKSIISILKTQKITNGVLVFLLFETFLLAQNGVKKNIFEYGKISTDKVEYSVTFSSELDEIYFARSNQDWGNSNMKSTIYYSVKENGKWSIPKIATFSGHYDDSDPHLTTDGKTLYYISNRRTQNDSSSADIWVVNKNQDGKWGLPSRLPNPINSIANEFSPRTDDDGNLYFASDRIGGYGQGDLYISKRQNGELAPPINLGNAINFETGEWNLEINGKGDLIIFEASQRKQNLSSYGDLYVSFKVGNWWTMAQNLKELNTLGSDLYPFLSENEKQLFFTSTDSLNSVNANIYYTDFRYLYEKYKNKSQISPQYLFVVNRSSHNISIIDIINNRLIKTIPVGIGPHEISISKNNRYAFIANYGAYPVPHEKPIQPQELRWIDSPQNTITRIDLSNYTCQTFKIENGVSYHGILTNRDGSLFWATDENNGIVKEFDGKSGGILKEYHTMPGSHILRSSLDFSKIFASNIESNTISVIDLDLSEVINIRTPEGPEGMEVSRDGNYIWVLCNKANKIAIINTKTHEIERIFDARGRFPVKIAFVNNEAWVTNVFSKNISIFNAKTFEFKEHIYLESSPLGIVSDFGRVFITLPRRNIIREYDSEKKIGLNDYYFGMEQDGMAIINDAQEILPK